jgi:MtN3 and saliva related transmembrane protein
MNNLFWIGSIAAIFTTAAFFPQVIKAYQTKHTKDLSLLMYLMLLAGLIIWIIYGILLHEAPIIAANSVTLVLTIYTIYLKVKYG